MLYQNFNGNGEIEVEVVWNKKFYEACKSELKHNYQIMLIQMNKIIDAKLTSQENYIVPASIVGKDWSGTPWLPIYKDACAEDFENSAKFLGLLICQVLINREESWYVHQKQGESYSRMEYFHKTDKKINEEKNKYSFSDLQNKFS